MIKSGKNEINRTSLTQKNAYFSKVRKKERTPKSNSQLYKEKFPSIIVYYKFNSK